MKLTTQVAQLYVTLFSSEYPTIKMLKRTHDETPLDASKSLAKPVAQTFHGKQQAERPYLRKKKGRS